MYSWKFSLWQRCFQNPGLSLNFWYNILQTRNKFRHVWVSSFLVRDSNSSELKSWRFFRGKGASNLAFFTFSWWLDDGEELLIFVNIVLFFDLKFIAGEDWPRLAMIDNESSVIDNQYQINQYWNQQWLWRWRSFRTFFSCF